MDLGSVLSDSIERLRAAGARFAYLFGSNANGTARPDSDVDIAAWFPESYDWFSSLAILSPPAELLVLNSAPLELAGRVALHGKLLFEVDPAERVHWEATTRKIYLDEKPRVDEARRVFIEGAQRRGRR